MADKFVYTVGRRKTSVATLRLFNLAGKNQINTKILEDLYTHKFEQDDILSPLKVAELNIKSFSFTAMVKGGGKSSQAEAVRLALARAIVKLEPEKKKALKDAGLLTRDPRMVERKKTGLRKARKAEQYSKR
jgi:small subunit ribosomal protein S9